MSPEDLARYLEAVARYGKDEVFTHEDRDVSPPIVRHFNATQIRHFVENTKIRGQHWPVVNIDLTRQIYDHMVNNQGVEEDKIKRLMQRPDIYAQPVLIACINTPGRGETHLIIDGSHRTVIQWRMGLRTLKAYFIPDFVWERYLVKLPSDPDFLDFSLGRGKYAKR